MEGGKVMCPKCGTMNDSFAPACAGCGTTAAALGMPAAPGTPGMPSRPGVPTAPDAPSKPGMPAAPGQPNKA